MSETTEKVYYSKINRNGLTTIPIQIRKSFNLNPDDEYRLEIKFKDGIITMRPVLMKHVPYFPDEDTSTGKLVPLDKK